MQPAGWIGHHQFSHLHRQGIRQPAGVATVHHGIGAGLLQAGVRQAPDRQGQGVDGTLGIQPGVVGNRDDQSQILAAIQGLLRHQPAPFIVWGFGSRQIPDDLAGVGTLRDVHAETALGIEQGTQIPADREVSLECQQQRLGQICKRRQKLCHP